MEMFRLMFDRFGPQYWWPGDGPFEMMVGALLTQNTSWTNVEKAINNLKRMNLLTVQAIHEVSKEKLAEVIRPAGYYNIKAARLKNLVSMLMERYEGDIFRLFDEDADVQREVLLSVKGIGPETADSIILYAAHNPVFVIDAYTYRILNRHNMADDQAAYDEIQELFMSSLEPDHELFNEFHALIVKTAKLYCRKIPQCDECPLNGWER
ncbi:MAG: endonuclease III domain-containing protein [Desulfatiglans sp.]|jgi:endonuclease-3 related protein|nr:endonuclease III domain-containing protein [Desulfatiglans sp.]